MSFDKPGKVEKSYSDVISSISDIIDDARNGRMFILVDHEDRENEGDLVIPCLLYTSPSPRDRSVSRMPSSA